MTNVISAELYKLKFNKAFYFCLLIVAVFSVYDIYTTKSDTATRMAISVVNSLNIFLCLTSCSIACEDYDKNTVKNLISSGNSRGHIYLGKLITTILAGLIYFIVDGIVSVVAAYVLNGFGKGISPAAAIESLVVQLLLVLVYVLMFFGIGSITRTSKVGIIVGLVFIFGIELVPEMLSKLAHIDGLEKFSLATLCHNITALSLSLNMIINFCIYCGVGIVLNLIGYVMFKKYKA